LKSALEKFKRHPDPQVQQYLNAGIVRHFSASARLQTPVNPQSGVRFTPLYET
jgi:hypothetical protein